MQLFELSIKNTERTVSVRELPVLRQAFVFAGTVVLTGVLLSIYVHSYFLALPLFVSGGLLFSGLSGYCPLVAVLHLLPGNRTSHQPLDNKVN